jgi:hypothetical protein
METTIDGTLESPKTQDTLNKQIIFSKKVGLTDKYNFYEYLSVMLDG